MSAIITAPTFRSHFIRFGFLSIALPLAFVVPMSCGPGDGNPPGDQFTITVTVSPDGAGSVALDPAQELYNAGQQVTLTATPAAGKQFDHWQGDATGNTNPVQVTVVDRNLQIEAVFVNPLESQYTITVTISPDGAGSVALDPAQELYSAGQQVTLTATPAAGKQFDHWEGDATGNTNPVQVTVVDRNLQITAVFVTSGGGGTIITENLRVLPDTVVVTTDDQGHTTLTGDGIPASLPPGVLIVSTRGDGQLLRVKGMPTTEGGQVTLDTEQAALTDVIRTGKIEFTVPFDPAKVVVETPAGLGPVDMKRVRFYRTGDRKAAFTTTDHSIELEDWGKVSLDQLTVEVDPTFDISADIEDWTLKSLRVAAGTSFHLSIDASVEAYKISQLINKEETIGKAKWPDPPGLIFIGGFPVIYQVYLEVKVGAEVEFGSLGVITAGFDFDTSATLGAQYNTTDGWGLINDVSTTLTPHTPSWGITPITARVYVQPEFGVKFFGVVGPAISWKEYLELVGGYKYDELGAEIARGSECDFNLRFKIVDGLPSYTYTHNLFKARQVLLARMAFRAEPEELGTVNASPDDLIGGFYLFTSPVSVSATPNAGYEVAGWVIEHLLDDGVESRKTPFISNEPIDASKLFTAGIVPEGYGDTWTGAGGGSGEPIYALTTEVFPPEAGTIGTFPGPDQGLYKSGINVLVSAIPNSAFTFHHWEVNLTGTNPVGTVTMNGNKTVRAVFASKPPGRRLCVPTSYPTIQAALNAATYNDTVCVEAGTFGGAGFHDLTFPRDHITIEGAGKGNTTIDLGSLGRFAEFDNLKGIRITDIAISNGSADYGGALKVDMKSEVSLSNVRIHNCTTTSNGGAVYLSNNDSKLTIDQCDFDHNQAYHGGGVYSNLAPDDETFIPQITNSTFSANTSQYDGGGINAAWNCNLAGCTLSANTAGSEGGGGYFGRSATVTNCNFLDNTANNGGGLYVGEGCRISDTLIQGNTARNSAGGIHLYKTTIESCEVSYNNANNEINSSGGEGGGIYAYICNIFGCNVHHNTAAREGGGIHASVTEIGDCTVEWNEAGWYGGGIYAGWGNVSGCSVNSNIAGVDGDISHSKGGGIYAEWEATVANSTVDDNEAVDGEGGGIWADATPSNNVEFLLITGISANFNRARIGAGIFGEEKVHLFNSEILNCHATYRAGGVWVDGDSLVSACVINQNEALNQAGAAVNESGIHSCSIQSNTATEEFGGGLSLFKSWASNCIIAGNTAVTQGGGVWTGIEASLSDCVIADNQVTGPGGYGGGIACHGTPDLSGLDVHNNVPDNCSADCVGCP